MPSNIQDKLQKVGNGLSAILLGNTRELIARIDERTNLMLQNLHDIKPKVDDMFPKVDILWKDRVAPANSPRQLNKNGTEILSKSGIKEIIDEKKDYLLSLVKTKNISTAYDAEQTILDIVTELPEHCPDIVDRLKTGAFNTGSDIQVILFVGGIYLRNLIFSDLGFSLTEIDGQKNIS
jgi:hypothetical protein